VNKISSFPVTLSRINQFKNSYSQSFKYFTRREIRINIQSFSS